MNKVILMGNLTRDPEIRYSQGENSLAIARFSIAVNRRFSRQGDTDTDFFNCTAFGKQAEFVEKYFRKGSRMIITLIITVKKSTVYRLLPRKLSSQNAKVPQTPTWPHKGAILAEVLQSRMRRQMMIL